MRKVQIKLDPSKGIQASKKTIHLLVLHHVSCIYSFDLSISLLTRFDFSCLNSPDIAKNENNIDEDIQIKKVLQNKRNGSQNLTSKVGKNIRRSTRVKQRRHRRSTDDMSDTDYSPP